MVPGADDAYYFEVLPAHPRPGPLEMSASWLCRLALANGVRTPAGLVDCLLPDLGLPPRRAFDLPLGASCAALRMRTACPADAVRATTFYHLARKFQLPLTGSHAFRPLASLVVSHLRYCPPCLEADPIYPLPWRFAALRACPRHGVRLLDACGHCGARVRLLSPSLRIGYCSTCGGDLRACSGGAPGGDERDIAAARWDDVSFLVSPHPCEVDPARHLDAIGSRFSAIRRARALTRRAVAADLAIPREYLGALEGPQARTVGRVPIGCYATYAWYLGLGLRQLFEAAHQACLAESEDAPPRPRRGGAATGRAVARGIGAGILGPGTIPGTIRALAASGRDVGAAPPSVAPVPAATRGAEDPAGAPGHMPGSGRAAPAAAEDREAEMLARVLRAVADLEGEGRCPGVGAIAARVGCDQGALYRHPSVRRALAPFVHGWRREKDRRAALRDAELARGVTAAGGRLRADGVRPTRAALARAFGRSLPVRRARYPETFAAIDRAVAPHPGEPGGC